MEAQGYEIKYNILLQDNQSAINTENNGNKLCTGNNRHIDIHYLFVKEMVEINNMSILYCIKENMLVYFFIDK